MVKVKKGTVTSAATAEIKALEKKNKSGSTTDNKNSNSGKSTSQTNKQELEKKIMKKFGGKSGKQGCLGRLVTWMNILI